MANKDKVMHPTNQQRQGGIGQVKSSIIEGPTATPENASPYNRGGNSSKPSTKDSMKMKY